MSWIWAALGGAAGASLRYGIYQWLNRCGSSPLEAVAPAAVVPTAAGTLVVNLLGSLLIGLVVGFFDAKSITDERLRIFLAMLLRIRWRDRQCGRTGQTQYRQAHCILPGQTLAARWPDTGAQCPGLASPLLEMRILR